jgi:hypothetical protein
MSTANSFGGGSSPPGSSLLIPTPPGGPMDAAPPGATTAALGHWADSPAPVAVASRDRISQGALRDPRTSAGAPLPEFACIPMRTRTC